LSITRINAASLLVAVYCLLESLIFGVTFVNNCGQCGIENISTCPLHPFVSRPGFYPDITIKFLRYLYSRLDLFSGAPGDVLSSNSNKNPSSFLSSFSKRSPQGVRPLYPYNKQYIETKVTFFLCFSDSLMSFDAMRHPFPSDVRQYSEGCV